MYSSKSESVELTSQLIPRPSISSTPDQVSETETQSNTQNTNILNRLRQWSRDQDQKIHLLIAAAIFAMLVWIALLSLQIHSLRRTSLHGDDIDDLKKEIRILKSTALDNFVSIPSFPVNLSF